MKLPSQLAAVLVPVACLVCPLVECFDRWDHTPQTGNDSEFVFMILALCFGAAFLLAHLIVSSWFAASCTFLDGRCEPPLPIRPSLELFAFSPLITISPPVAELRI